MKSVGSLVVVGTGLQVGHITLQAEGEIKAAELVFYLVSDVVTERYICDLNASAESLYRFYRVDKHRHETYAEMTEHIAASVRDGRRVCAVFYGHPGVFVSPSHAAIRKVRKEGFKAKMLPALSAEDCLFADLGVDPVLGCLSFEATDFLIRDRPVDPTCMLIIWQIGVIGDATWKPTYDHSNLRFLKDRLLRFYSSEHLVTVYEASQFVIAESTTQIVELGKLCKAKVSPISTLYIPPASTKTVDRDVVSKLQMQVTY